MNTRLEEAERTAKQTTTLRLELESCRRELGDCHKRLEQLECFFVNVADAVFVTEPDGQIIDANPAACAVLGFSKEELLRLHPWDFVTNASREEILELVGAMKGGVPVTVQRACRVKNGQQKIMDMRLTRCGLEGRDLVIVACRDITERNWAEACLAGQNRLLELVARGESLSSVLDAMCCLVEELSSGGLCSILLLDADGERLWHAAGPGLPKGYTEAVNGREISGGWGPCGTAAIRKEQVIAADIKSDPLWERCRESLLAHGLQACWSTPVFSSDGKVLGTFAILHRQPRSPSPQDQKLIEQFSHFVSIAIERERAQGAARASEQLARGQVAALTRTLDALAMESAPDTLVGHVLRTITELLGAHSTSVWRRDDTTGLVCFESAFENGHLVTKSDSVIAALSPPLPVEDVWPWPEVFRTGKPHVLEDIRQGPGFPWRDHVLGLGVITILIVPMLIAGKVQGVIGIRFTQKRAFRNEEMELAQALANQAMLAMQLTRLSAQSRQAAVVAERNRLARDIHDTLAQGFTGVIVQLEAAEDASSRGLTKEASEHLGRAGELARESLQEARRSVRALRPQALETNNLGGALEDLIRKMTSGAPVRTEFKLAGQPRPLPALWEENLLHIGQEVLTNSLRHSRANHFTARLAFDPAELRLELRDDGRGFDPDGRHDGLGLVGIRERVQEMGGQLTLQSASGEGTSILIVLPLTSITAPSAS